MRILNFLIATGTEIVEKTNNTDYRLIMVIISAFSGAVIGGLITIWYKRKELKNMSENLNLQSENLNLQKQMFEETSKNNELKIKVELVRLEDLNRQYQLSIQKYDFDHLSKVLDFAGDSNQKVKMLKDFSNILKEYNPNSSYHYDKSEYEEYIIYHVYNNLEFIDKKIGQLLTDYPNVFNSLHKDFISVKGDSNYLISYANEIQCLNDNFDNEYIISQLASSLLKLNENFYDLLSKMKQEFLELDTLKKQYIRSQFEIRADEKKE